MFGRCDDFDKGSAERGDGRIAKEHCPCHSRRDFESGINDTGCKSNRAGRPSS